MKTDIEIARSTELKNIREIAANVGFPDEEVFNYGKYIAKIPYKLIDDKKVAKTTLFLSPPLLPLRPVWVRLP